MGQVKERASRNQTIDLTPDEEREYLKLCIDENDVAEGTKFIDRIVYGDCFSVLQNIPENSVDLLIVDPPYTSTFRKMDELDYGDFTRKWISSTLHTLKKTASVYVCCDWKTSLIIGSVLCEYFTVQNRITWQREK